MGVLWNTQASRILLDTSYKWYKCTSFNPNIVAEALHKFYTTLLQFVLLYKSTWMILDININDVDSAGPISTS